MTRFDTLLIDTSQSTWAVSVNSTLRFRLCLGHRCSLTICERVSERNIFWTAACNIVVPYIADGVGCTW